MNAIEELFKRINYKQVLSVKSELLYATKITHQNMIITHELKCIQVGH